MMQPGDHFRTEDEFVIVIGTFQAVGGQVWLLQCKDCKMVALRVGPGPATIWHNECPTARERMEAEKRDNPKG